MAASEMLEAGLATEAQASAIVQHRAEQINRCPAYVRQAVKMLTKALRAHESNAGIVEEEAENGLAPVEEVRVRQHSATIGLT